MGYPMTFRRILDRNELHDGDYDKPPMYWNKGLAHPVSAIADNSEALMRTVLTEQEKLTALINKVRLLAGDLRRFQHDALDENGICKQIATELKLDTETVAMVIRKFLEI